MITDILQEAKNRGILFYLDANQQLAFKAPQGAFTEKFKSVVIEHKYELIDFLRQKRSQQGPVRIPRADTLPLSYSQQRLWFIDTLEGKSAQYNIPIALKLDGRLNRLALEKALTAIVERHEILRTVYVTVAGEGRQRIGSGKSITVHYEDLRNIAPCEQENRVQAFRQEWEKKPFELSKDLMLRAALLQQKNEEFVLLLTLHHIASDGWSMGILVKEFTALYSTFVGINGDSLAELSIQYADYAVWQQDACRRAELQRSLNFWRQKLKDLPMTHSLPLDSARPALQQFDGAQVQHDFNESQLKQLNQLALRHNCTLYMLLHSILAVVVAKWSRNDDVVIGTPLAGRNHKSLEGVIGFFVNSLVLRSQLNVNQPFELFLQDNRKNILAAFEHQEVPFEQLLESLKIERSLAHTPLFQIMFSVQNGGDEKLALPELKISGLSPVNLVAKFDLDISVIVYNDRLQLNWLYAKSLFNAQTIQQLTKSFSHVVSEILHNSMQPICDIPWSASPLKLQLAAINTAEHERTLLHHKVEKHALLHGDKLALKTMSEQISYKVLNANANRLARSWQSQGVQVGDRIVVRQESGYQQLLSLLAIFKLGAIFVPVDPMYPTVRFLHILNDSQAHWLVTDVNVLQQTGAWQQLTSPAPSYVDEAEDGGVGNLHISAPADQCAYIIYTSGTTGQPKGVMVSYAAITDHIEAISKRLDIDAGDILLPFASLSVDAALDLTLSAWSCGASIAVRESGIPTAKDFYRQCQQLGVTVLDLPPAFLVDLLSQAEISKPFWQSGQVRLVIMGGEAMSPTIMQCWQDWNLFQYCHLVNAYGPTETVITATLKYFTTPAVITIGSEVGDRKLLILDGAMNFVPDGAPGELYVAGSLLAMGYFEQPELTAEHFIEHPLFGLMYKTGDLVRMNESGELRFFGRVDQQLQIRGFRVEPMEIREAILGLPFVHESVVQAMSNGLSTVLVAYVQIDATFQHDDIIQHLRDELQHRLVSYMIPAKFMLVSQFHYTENGKIDFTRLPQTAIHESVSQVAPRNAIEQQMCDIWSAHLGQHISCVRQNFFELGGHSLVAVKVVADVSENMQLAVSVRDLFTHSTIERFVAHLAAQNRYEAIAQRPDGSVVPLSFHQQRIWFLHQLEGQSSQYNMPVALSLKGRLNESALTAALNAVIDRHAVLRTQFINEQGVGYQTVLQACKIALIKEDLTGIELAAAKVIKQINTEVATSFDLNCDQLMIRARLLKLAENDHVFMVNVHHIASDGWSVGIIIKEFSQAYQSYCKGLEPVFEPLPIQYADYAYWQRHNASEDSMTEHLAFWQQYLADVPAVHSLPLSYQRPPDFEHRARIFHQTLDISLVDRLTDLAKDQQLTLFNVLQTAFAILLARWGNSEDVVMGTPVAGRERPELQGLVGLLVNTLVLRTQVRLKDRFSDLLKQNSQHVRAAFSHQTVPFEMLVQALKIERDSAHAPLFQIMFSMQNLDSQSLELPGLEIYNVLPSEHVAKFDLELSCGVVNGKLKLTWNYATALFETTVVARMADSFAQLLTDIAEHPDTVISDIDIMPPEDRQALELWNKTDFEFDQTVRIPQLLALQAQLYPDQTALMMDDEKPITYKEFNLRVNQLAHWLIDSGVQSGAVVGIACYRSFEMVVAIHAVLKAGAAYLPMDPDLPENRLKFLAQDSELKLILCEQSILNRLVGIAAPIITFESLTLNDCAVCEPDISIKPEDAAYVIYTSGTTGKPKGVVIEHLALSNRIHWMQHHYCLSKDDVVMQKTPFNFDVAVWELVWPLTVGAKLAVTKAEGHKDPLYLSASIQRHQVTCLHFVPSMLAVMVQSGGLSSCLSLRQVFCSGESLPLSLTQAFHSQHKAKLHNLYGPTEATIDVSYWESTENSLIKTVPIGKPIHNTQLFVLDGASNPVPIGVTGELHIGGIGLARAYLNRVELTQQQFISTDRIDGIVRRLYKTGDLVRYLPDGNLEYLGRNDHQVKINGFRVELGEIEAKLLSHPQILEAVVIAQKQSNGTQQLVAYFCTSSSLNITELTAQLERDLPHYMVPQYLIKLDAMPLSANGKLDRKQLPATQTDNGACFAAPSTALQIQISELWRSQLGCDVVGLDDNFFHLGGDSIKAISVVTNMVKFGVSVSLKDLFQAKTVRKLAELVNASDTAAETLRYSEPFALLNADEHKAISDLQSTDQLDDAYPLTLLQQGMFFYGALYEGQGVYHDIFNARIDEQLDEQAFRLALQSLMREHEVLRASLLMYGKRPLQLIHRDRTLPFNLIDLTSLDSTEQQIDIGARLKLRRSQAVKLEEGYWQITVLRLNASSFQYILDFHHAMWDGWSIASFNNALFARYRRLVSNNDGVVSTSVPLPYRYYVEAEQLMLKSKNAAEFWLEMLKDASLPWWSQHQLTQSRTATLSLVGGTADAIRQLAKQLNVQEKSVMQSAHIILIALLSGKQDVVTSYVTNGRPELPGSELTLGLFLNTIPMRIKLNSQSWHGLVKSVDQGILDAHNYRQYPVAEIQSLTGLDFSASMFNYTNFHVYDASTIGDRVRIEESFEQNSYLWATEVAKSESLSGNGYHVKFSAEKTVFSEDMLLRGKYYFGAILQQLLQFGEQPIQLPKVYSEHDIQRIQTHLAVASPSQLDWLDAIESVARLSPCSTAIVWGETLISYQQLLVNVNVYVERLRHIGVKRGSVVALCLPRSPEYVKLLLALYKLGAVYLPLDPAHPSDRIDYMLSDSQAGFVILDASTENMSPAVGCQPYTLQQLQLLDVSMKQDVSDCVIDSTHLAYIIYTSGSTGKPKGVMISRKALNQFIFAANKRLSLDDGVEWLSLTTTVFDISLLELIAPLCCGGKLHLLAAQTVFDAQAVVSYLHQSEVNFVQATPSGWKALIAAGWQGNDNLMGLTGGEALSTDLAQTLLQRCGKGVINCYGPTEATIWSNMAEVTDPAQIHLGEKLAGYGFCVVDELLCPVLPGVPGELILSGHALADGYWARSDLTNDKFVQLPEYTGERVYKTGDSVILNDNDQLIYLGRIDEQVKIRGFRIELGEIEAQLRLQDNVKEAVVIARMHQSSTVLVAYLQLNKAVHDGDELRHQVIANLSRKLPEYMLPSFVLQVDNWPLTPSGKLDRKSLPAPGQSHSETLFEPANETEKALQEIWSELLGGTMFSTETRFFSAGGDSILAIRLLTEINSRFDVEFSIKDIFSYQSIAEQSLHIDLLKLAIAPAQQAADESVTEIEW